MKYIIAAIVIVFALRACEDFKGGCVSRANEISIAIIGYFG